MSIRKEDIGQNAKRARESNGFSQANVADFLKVDQSLISKFENGDRSIQSDLLERLANLYVFRVCDFESVKGIPEQRIKAAYRSSGISTDDMEAIHDIKRIALKLFFMNDLAGGENVER